VTLKLSRRDLMIGASSTVGAVALGGLAGRYSRASEASSSAPNPAFAPIDRSLRQAVDNRTVAGAVAIAATQQGIVYEGSSGVANRDVGFGDVTGHCVLAAINDQGDHCCGLHAAH